MKIKKFKIDVYQWDVTLIEAESKDDFPKVKKELVKFGMKKSFIKDAKASMSMFNGGDHFYKIEGGASLILLYPLSEKKKRLDTLCHEKRHLEDRILEYYGIKDIEAAAYLSGYLGKKLL